MKKMFILLISLLLLSGCYDNIELNNLAIISGVGIDYKDDNYYLTYEILNDTKTENNTAMLSYTMTGSGKNLSEAFINTNYKVGKKPFFDHLKVVLYSESIIEDHLEDITDYLIRDTNIRDEFIPLVAKDTTPEEILKHNSDNYPVVSDYIMNLVNNEKYNNNLAVTDVFQKFLAKLVSPNSDAILSSLSINEMNEITLSNFYAFDDFHYADTLSIKDSSLYNLLTQNTFSLNFTKDYDNKNVNISLTASSSDIDVTKDEININLKLKGKVVENNADLDLKEQKTYKILNEDFGEVIKDDVTSFVHTIQNMKSDVLSLSDIYFRKTRKENNNLWFHAKVNVNVDLKINTKGFIFEVEQ